MTSKRPSKLSWLFVGRMETTIYNVRYWNTESVHKLMQDTHIFSKLNWLIKCAVQLVSYSQNSLFKSLVRWSINLLKLYFRLRCYFTSRLNSSGWKYHSTCFAHNLANDLRDTCSMYVNKEFGIYHCEIFLKCSFTFCSKTWTYACKRVDENPTWLQARTCWC